jgi:predicted Zn finger-like uncharacterized protein
VVVICPKCKVRLKVADEKISPEGTRFKCPKCSTVLLVKRPVSLVKPLNEGKILVAHEDPSIRERLKAVLASQGYKVITAIDGIEAMVTTTRELPFLVILGVSLPKIYGFEVTKRLKNRPETKDIKIILLASVYDARRYRREPESLHHADDYIEEQTIESSLIEKINALKRIPEKEPVSTPRDTKRTFEETTIKERVEEKPLQPSAKTLTVETKEPVERARRLARTILSDIYLYSKAKVDDSIVNNTFHRIFAPELKEGLKLYEHRVPVETRALGDFFSEEINIFIEKKKREFSQYS